MERALELRPELNGESLEWTKFDLDERKKKGVKNYNKELVEEKGEKERVVLDEGMTIQVVDAVEVGDKKLSGGLVEVGGSLSFMNLENEDVEEDDIF